MSPSSLTAALKDESRRLGFALAGACAAVEPTGVSRLAEWLARGYAGEMDYLSSRQQAYAHPRHVLDGVRSILMLAMPYHTSPPREARPGEGRISRYAWGPGDYHDVLHDRLKRLIAVLKALVPTATARGVVDTAPLLEREFAQLAGLGWIGKNTLLLNKPAGSYFVLAALLTDQELAYDQPFTADHCGNCRACIDACPTQAFPEPYVLNATRCISYLTIELRGPVPAELRPGMGDWLFGCDICQEVCPWNHRSPESSESQFHPSPDSNPVDLHALFDMDDAAFRARFRHTPLWRAKRRGILRNAALVLGNQIDASSVSPLVRGLNDAEPLVRGAAAWALGRMASPGAIEALESRHSVESDASVRLEIESALTAVG